jgi:GxxExxY protein
MKIFEPLSPDVEELAMVVVDSAYRVHTTLGPGLLESVYETCLAHELRTRGAAVKTQVSILIVYGDIRLEAGLKIDLLIKDLVIVEVKAVDAMNRVFKAQVLTYLKLTGLRLGFLINFNVPLIKNGIERVIL